MNLNVALSPEWRWPVSAALLVVVLAARTRGRGVLGMMAVLYLVLAFGPVVHQLRGGTLYEGTVLDHVQVSAQGFTLALVGLLLAELLVPQRRTLAMLVPGGRSPGLVQTIGGLQTLLIAFAVLTSARLLPSAGLSKPGRIALAGPWHYPYLTLSIVVLACWPLVRASRNGRRLYVVQLLTYVGYGVLTQERDFVFVLFGLAVLSAATQLRRSAARAVLVSGVVYAAVSLLDRGRSADPDRAGAVFGGSLLFVDTRVHEYVPVSTPHQHGLTYLDALAAAVSHGLWGSAGSPTGWLVDQYAPGSGAGYGFSMTAEAYLNFGQIGIVPVFLVLGCAVNLVVNRIDRSPLWAHLGYFLAMFVPYMFRSDSRGLFAGVVTCLVVHLLARCLALVLAPPSMPLRSLEPARWNKR